MSQEPLRFNLSIFADEDPAVYAALLPLKPKDRGRKLRSWLRGGFALASGGHAVVAPAAGAPADEEAFPGMDPRDFKFGAQAS